MLVVLLIVGVMVSRATFFFARENEDEKLESLYVDQANLVLEAFQGQIEMHKLLRCDHSVKTVIERCEDSYTISSLNRTNYNSQRKTQRLDHDRCYLYPR